MMQIIGWILCVYLIVKGFELLAMKSVWANIGAAIAFIAVPIFLWLLDAQVTATSNPPPTATEQFNSTDDSPGPTGPPAPIVTDPNELQPITNAMPSDAFLNAASNSAGPE